MRRQVRRAHMNGVTIGAVTKEWGGLIKEYFTDIDTFNVSFPLDLDVNMKAALLAAALLIKWAPTWLPANAGCRVRRQCSICGTPSTPYDSRSR